MVQNWMEAVLACLINYFLSFLFIFFLCFAYIIFGRSGAVDNRPYDVFYNTVEIVLIANNIVVE